jgi:hypothetical protein
MNLTELESVSLGRVLNDNIPWRNKSAWESCTRGDPASYFRARLDPFFATEGFGKTLQNLARSAGFIIPDAFPPASWPRT